MIHKRLICLIKHWKTIIRNKPAHNKLLQKDWEHKAGFNNTTDLVLQSLGAKRGEGDIYNKVNPNRLAPNTRYEVQFIYWFFFYINNWDIIKSVRQQFIYWYDKGILI